MTSNTILSEIDFVNFKCFSEQVLSLGPLTLFTGHNAAGKSTSIQGILLLSRIFQTGSASISLASESINIGSFGEMLNDKAAKAKESKVEFQVKIASVAPGENRRESVKITFCIKKDSREGFESHAKLTDLRISTESSDGGDDNSHKIDLDEHPDLNDTSHIPEVYKESYDEFIKIIKNVIYLSAERNALQDAFPKVTDANPVVADVGAKGRYASWWFRTYSDEEVDGKRLCQSGTAPTLRQQVNAWLGRVFPGAQADTDSISGTNLVKQQFRISDYEDFRRPGNIGYGISYIFPIMVSALLAEKGQVIIIDSPEAHLHPAGQSAMGRFLAVIASSGVQLIIETHSDHLLNGIRLAVKEKSLSCDDVRIYFFRNILEDGEQVNHVVSSIHVNDKGKLSNWPEGFFDQSEKDLSRLIS